VVKPDPWNRAYIYVCPAQQNPDPEGFDLYSSGPDGRPNTDDDVVSWK
jgi:general secretion pathway protein G